MKPFFVLFIFLGTVSQAFAQNIGIGTETPQAMLDINGDVVFRTAELPVTDSVTIALDVNQSKFSSYRITQADSAFIIAGITAGMDGRLLTLINQTGQRMTLTHADPLAEPADQIMTSTHEPILLEDMGTVDLQYDSIVSKWIVHTTNQAAPEAIWDTTGNNIFFENYVGIGTESPSAPLSIETELDEVGFSHMAGEDSITVASSVSAMSGAVGTTSNHMFSLKSNDEGALHILPQGNIIVGTTTQASQLTGPLASRLMDFTSKLTVFTNEYGVGYQHVGGDNLIKLEEGFDLGLFEYYGYIGTKTDHPFRLRAGQFNAGLVHLYPNTYRVVIGDVLDPEVGKLTVYSGADGLGMVHVGQNGPVLRTHCGTTSASIGTTGNHNLRFVTNDQNRLNIRYDGVIGINTIDPVEWLTVQTPASQYGISHRSDGGIVLSTHVGVTSSSFGTRSPHNFRLVTSDVSRLSITYDGKVGIGTDSPIYLFEVKGTMRAQELIIETANWPDYVFSENYELRPLREVEKFINEHHHLPNIPAAHELETDGLEIGDMQKKMMEKIEELTLYIIDLEKRIAAFEQTSGQQ